MNPALQSGCSGTDSFACQAESTLRGAEEDDHIGFSLSACGDWNGDGLTDLLAGGAYPWDGGNNPSPGKAYVYFGSPSTGCDDTPDLNIEDAVQSGQGEVFGWSTAFIGDLDGDGRQDFAVGAPRAPFDPSVGPDGEWVERGRVYVFLSGSYAPPSGSACISRSANLIIEDTLDWARFGHSIAEVGDFAGSGIDEFDWNGDGVPDLVVGAPGGQNSDPLGYTGAVYVIWGGSIVAAAKALPGNDCSVVNPGNLVSLGGTGISILESWTGKTSSGLERRDRFGYSVAIAGEIGDPLGYPDIVVGAPQFLTLEAAQPDGMWGPGYVRVLHGPGTMNYYEFVGPGDPADPDTYGCFGFSVSGQVRLSKHLVPGQPPLLDFDEDILVGEPLFDDVGPSGSGLTQCGKAYAYSVRDGFLLTSLRGRGSDWFLGWQVQGLGAFNTTGEQPDSWATCASMFGTTASTGTCSAASPACLNGTDDPGESLCGRVFVVDDAQGQICAKVTGENFRDSCG